jgi:two-component system, NarL family, response regulator NreC
MRKLQIFLVDDHGVVREGLKRLLELEPDLEVVGEASNGRDAVDRAILLRPDVVIMDISMPEMNGAQATIRLKETCPETKVLVLTVHEDKSFLHELLEAGASGYVLKRTATDELINAVRAVAAGAVYLDTHVAGNVVQSFVRPRRKDRGPGPDLSDRETRVLRLIAEGYSNKEIAAQLDLSVKTIETYKTRSMEKLDLHSRVEIVRYAADRGWLKQT